MKKNSCNLRYSGLGQHKGPVGIYIYICTSGTSRYHISNYIGDVMRIELDIHGIPPTSWAG